MTSFFYDINQFKFYVADIEQIKKDFARDSAHIFINGRSLKKIYKEMNLTVEKENDIQEEHLSKIWTAYCFKKTDEKQLPYWQKFAEALFHQGGLLYAFEAALKEKMNIPNENGEAYFPEKIKKEVYIRFDKQCLTIQENVTLKKIIQANDSDKGNNYQINAKVSHHVSLIEQNMGFQHKIELPIFECKNPELQQFLEQKRLSIREIFNNIISKIFRLKFEPNRYSFFQNPYYQSEIASSQIIKKEDNSNLLKNDYTKIVNHG